MSLFMITLSYIRTALRNFKKRKVTSIINLCGLSLGLATCLVAGLFTKHELTADLFQKDLHITHIVTSQIKDFSLAGTPYGLGEAAKQEAPGVTAFIRLRSEYKLIRIGEEKLRHEVVYSDPQFFSFFTFQLNYGNSKKALEGLNQVVLSERTSKKYFGDENPVGQSIQILLKDAYVDFEITGVMKPAPTFSSIQFDFLIPLQNALSSSSRPISEWEDFYFTTLLKIEPGKEELVTKAFAKMVDTNAILEKNVDGSPMLTMGLKPFAGQHLDEHGMTGNGLVKGRSAQSLLAFGAIAVIILLLACFNFMNLTNAQASRRAAEVGVRKIIGAQKRQLLFQFLSETIVLSLLATVLALGLAELGLLLFNDLLGATLSVFDRGNADLYLGLIVVTVFSGIVAGLYPALILSQLHALDTFRKHVKVGGMNAVTKTVLCLQFVLSTILIVCAITMWRQQAYMFNKDLGFNKAQVLVIPFTSRDSASIDYLKTEIKKLAEVVSVSKTTTAVTRSTMQTLYRFPDGTTTFIELNVVDEDFFPTLEMKMAEGKMFTNNDLASNNIIVNETLLKMLSLEDSVGITLGRKLTGIEHPTIVGVVKDFHNIHMKVQIRPSVFICNRYENAWNSETFLMARINPGQLLAGKQKIKKLWEDVNTESPFDYFFLDDEVQKQYAAEERWFAIISLATGIAVFLSMLGMLGLAMYAVEQRKKEISIRKVLGASINQLITLLSKDYLWLVLIAFALAVPAAHYIMTQFWLNSFAYHISMHTTIYLLAALMVVLMIALAVGGQIIRAARQNPADTLKEE